MEWVETTGRTIEDAKEAALDELGVDAEDAEFEVLEEPKQGLFGRIRSEGRVRARVRPVAPPAKDDRRRRGRAGRSGGRAGAKDTAGTAPASTLSEDDDDAAEGPSSGSSSVASAEAAPDTDVEPSVASTEDANGGTDDDQGTGASGSSGSSGGSRSGRRRRSRSRNRSGSGGGGAGAGTGADDASPDSDQGAASANTDGQGSGGGQESGGGQRAGAGASKKRSGQKSGQRGSSGREARDRNEEGTDVEVALDEQAAVATEFLRGLVDEFGLTAEITSSQPDDDTVQLSLDGSDLGLLIGPKGTTLLAIQDLTRTVVQRRTGAGNGRIHVDVGGYRQKRAEALGRFALQIAEEVKRTGTRKALEPMSAPDRKVVHDALTEVEGVSTMSEGEDSQRRVVISPND